LARLFLKAVLIKFWQNLVLLDAFCNLYPDKVFTDDDYYNKIAHAIVPAMVTFLQNKN